MILKPLPDAGVGCVEGVAEDIPPNRDDVDPALGGVPDGGFFEGVTPGLQVGGEGVGGTWVDGALEGGVLGAGSDVLEEDVAGHGTFTHTCSTFGRGGGGDAGVWTLLGEGVGLNIGVDGFTSGACFEPKRAIPNPTRKVTSGILRSPQAARSAPFTDKITIADIAITPSRPCVRSSREFDCIRSLRRIPVKMAPVTMAGYIPLFFICGKFYEVARRNSTR